MNYFELFNIPLSFMADESELKKKYFELSRQFHPDFFSSSSAKVQEEMLRQSTLVTNAYRTLSDFDLRMKYLLTLKGLIREGEKYELPAGFLSEMMEINEKIMDIKMNNDKAAAEMAAEKINSMLSGLHSSVESSLNNYNETQGTDAQLKQIKDYYYQKKYLLRIRESLDSFAAP